jgi:F420-dependent oxidoreductase-like protein
MEFRAFIEPQQGATYEQQLRVARQAESAGYGAFFRSDHVMATRNGGPPGPTESWVTLAGIARETTTIRLGTLMTSATFRHPGMLAIQVAQVDAMSGGRVELGLGSGWFEPEHTAYGLPFPSTRERFDRLAEQVEIITGLWASPPGETFSYDGAHYQLKDSPALPKPVQPKIPLLMGGRGKKRTPELAARYCDEFNGAFTAPEHAAELYAGVRAACEANGRDWTAIRRSVSLTIATGASDATVAARAAAGGWDPKELSERELCGSPSQVTEKLGRYAEIGVDRVYLQFMDLDDLDHIDFVAAEIVPQFARQPGGQGAGGAA